MTDDTMIPEFNGDFYQWLRGFYYTAQTGSMSSATSRMNRNQSALTYQIKSLEKALGVKLFDGTKTNRVLTDEGKYLLSRTVQIFDIINETKGSIGALPSELEGEIAITAMFSALQGYLPPRLTYFCGRYPGIRFNVNGESQQHELFRQVSSRESDFGIVCSDEIPADLNAEPLFQTDLVLITPKHGPYAVTDLKYLESLTHLPMIASPDKSSLRQFITRQMGRYGLTLNISHVVWHQEALKECVRLGMGVGILDRFVCEGWSDRLNLVSLSDFFMQRQYSLIWRTNMFLFPHFNAFIQYLKNEEKFRSQAEEADRARQEDAADAREEPLQSVL